MPAIEEAIESTQNALEVLAWCQENADEKWMVDHLALVRKHIYQALAKLRQAPKPTSLGNTIRRIADNTKMSETDKNIIYQTARKLDVWWEYIGELKKEIALIKAPTPTELKLPVFLHDDYDGLYSVAQALAKRFMELYAENAKLRVKPKPTEFTKEWRNKSQNLLVFAHLAETGKTDASKDTGKSWTLLAKALLEACDIIEQLEADIETERQSGDAMLEQIKKLQAQNGRYETAVGLALHLEDVESIRSILSPFKK